MFRRNVWCWFVCSAVLGVYAGGCTGEISPELLEVDDQAAALNEQWVRCAREGEFCAFSGTRKVRYGQKRYAIRTYTGGVKCIASNFATTRRNNAHCDVDMSAANGGTQGPAGAPPAAGSGGAGSGAAGAPPAPPPPPPPPAAGSGGAGSGAAGAPVYTPPPTTSAWPGSTGKSGVNGDPVLNRASVEAFCTWRGRPCGVAHTYTDRSNWDSMTRGSGWVFSNFSGFPGLLVVSQGLVPNGGAADLPACASGTYDQHFRDFGTLMVNQGRAASVVRLGWEFNGTWMPWSATNATTWKQCFQHAATAIRQTNPSVLIDWTINAHGTPSSTCGGSSLNCYPGDAFVDIIGIDNYDHGPSVATAADFNRVADATDGMSWLFNFAKQHGKKFSVGEWGIAPGSDYNGTGENPEFIRWMNQWFAAHASDLLYESYFNSCMANDVESNLFRPVGSGCVRLNSTAGSVYQSVFGR